jgi:hypothetical protein
MPRGASSIKMSLASMSPNQAYINSIISNKSTNDNVLPTLKKPTTLKSPMISRINGVKAGCGSCGRK